MARDDGDHPFLDPRRAVHRAGPRHLLRRLRPPGRARLTTPSDPLGWSPSRPLVVGFAVTGQAMTAALVAHGAVVTVVDDHPAPAARRVAELASVDLVEAPSAQQLATLVAASDAVLPSPGVPDRHPVFAAARAAHVPVLSEFDLAAAWDDRPLLAITGTDGKTTVT
ncbi:MAG: hypothetical protein ACXWA3_19245, partial [Acidimicrobiales bacterium]